MGQIYKYYSPTDYNFDALINHYFYFSKRSNLNDPYDMNAKIFDAFPKFKKLLEEKGFDIDMYKETLDKYAICSFTQNCNNKHFWSLYADNYKGWCLEFDDTHLVDTATTGVLDVLYDVHYLDTIPNLNDRYQDLRIKDFGDGNTIDSPINTLLYDERGTEQLFAYLLSIKEKSIWGVEEEKRLILGNTYLLTQKEISGKGYKIPWFSGCLCKIIIGHLMSDAHQKIIQLIAMSQNVPVYKATPQLSGRDFKLEIEKI